MKHLLIAIAAMIVLTGCNEPKTRWTINKDGTATDNATGLVWQRCLMHQKLNKESGLCNNIDPRTEAFVATPGSTKYDVADEWIVATTAHLATLRECSAEDANNPMPVRVSDFEEGQAYAFMQYNYACVSGEGPKPEYTLPKAIFPFVGEVQAIVRPGINKAYIIENGYTQQSAFSLLFGAVNTGWGSVRDYKSAENKSFGDYIAKKDYLLTLDDQKRPDFPKSTYGFLLVKQPKEFLNSDVMKLAKINADFETTEDKEKLSFLFGMERVYDNHRNRFPELLGIAKADIRKQHCNDKPENASDYICTDPVRPIRF